MAYFTMPDAMVWSSTIIGGGITLFGILYKFKPSKPNGNGNGKVSKEDIKRIELALKDKQNTNLCEQIRINSDNRHQELRKLAEDISIQNKKLTQGLSDLNISVAEIKAGINELKERRKYDRHIYNHDVDD